MTSMYVIGGVLLVVLYVWVAVRIGRFLHVGLADDAELEQMEQQRRTTL